MTSEESPPEVGQRLAAARLQRGLAQNEVARRAGLAPSYLSRIETGKVHPTIGTVMQVARAMGADLGDVLGRVGATKERGPCPVTHRGQCLLDLISPKKSEGHFTAREVRLIRRFASWVEGASSTRMRAMEVLLDDLVDAAPSEPS